MGRNIQKPTSAFILSSWGTLFIGLSSYLIGLWNSSMMLNEKGFYFTVLLFGLFSAVSLQKTVRDKLEEIPVTDIYYCICWFSLIAAILLLSVGLWYATLDLSVKGFYGISYLLSLFAVITVQKNVRDLAFFAHESDSEFNDIEEENFNKN